MSGRIIVFSGHNIFTEGIVTRLREYASTIDIIFMDAVDVNYIEKVSKLCPSIIIIDSVEEMRSQKCLLRDLLNEFPTIKIVRLKVQENDVQVITSSSHMIENVSDLITLIN